jgi:hypothetical protein
MKAECPVCKRDCRNPQNLASHIKARHPEYLAPEPEPEKKQRGPKPKYESREQAYDARRAWNAANSRSISAAGRDIAPIPEVVNPERRARCSQSLLQHCLEYYPHKFFLPFSPDHLRVIRKAERAVREGGLSSIAMPRGNGKSEICKAAAQWAVLNGYRRFVVLIGATDELAQGLMTDIQVQLETNDLLYEDYPEACYPIRKLERILLRARGQLHNGEPTYLEWTNGQLRLAQLPGSVCSGAVIRTVGITGALRGMSVPGPDGETIRPDLVLVDDPQTRSSAPSPTQCRTREQIILGDVLGLAGPTKKVACLMPCTVIAPGDVADRFLNRELFPEWQGERTKLVVEFPKNQALWDEYFLIRDADLKADGTGSQARDFYRQHRQEMDEGCVLSWPERYDRDAYESATEEAMCYKQYKPEAFWAEAQNEPLAAGEEVAGSLSAGVLADKSNNQQRGLVPPDAQLLTAGIDVQKGVLYWTVTAWTEEFGGHVIDFGAFPKQNRRFFRALDARPSLADVYPGMDENARIYAGLTALTEQLLGQPFPRDGGGELRVESCFIDSGKWQELIFQFCKQSKYASVLVPSKGYGLTATSLPMSEWTRRPDRRFFGKHAVRNLRTGQLQFDTNYWKSQVANRLLTAPGGSGCLWLPGGDIEPIIDHLTAEYRVAAAAPRQGRKVDEWQLKGSRDNHWWDTLVLSAVAASVRGITFNVPQAAGVPVEAKPVPQARPVVSGARRDGGVRQSLRERMGSRW